MKKIGKYLALLLTTISLSSCFDSYKPAPSIELTGIELIVSKENCSDGDTVEFSFKPIPSNATTYAGSNYKPSCIEYWVDGVQMSANVETYSYVAKGGDHEVVAYYCPHSKECHRNGDLASETKTLQIASMTKFFDKTGLEEISSTSHASSDVLHCPENTESDFLGWTNGYSLRQSGESFSDAFSSNYYPVYGNYNESAGLKFEDVDGGCKVVGYSGYDYDVVIPFKHDGKYVVAIGDYAFNKKTITSVKIPQTVRSIGSYAFESSSIEKCTFGLGSSLQSIGKAAFSAATKLKYIIIPESVTSIGQYGFHYTLSLTLLFQNSSLSNIKRGEDWNDNNRPYYLDVVTIVDEDSSGKYSYAIFKDRTVGLLSLIDAAFGTDIVVDTIDNFPVSTIMVNSFSKKVITSVKFSSTIKKISINAFAGCSTLTTVDFSEATNLEVIGSSAFKDCTGIETVDLLGCQSLKQINDSAFANCTGMEEIIIPKSVNAIGSSCFAGSGKTFIFFVAESLDGISRGDHWNNSSRPVYCDVKRLGGIDSEGRYRYVVTNEDLAVPYRHLISGESEIDLTKTIDNLNVGGIALYLFYNDKNIKKVTIPATCKYIDSSAFRDCSNLEEVVFEKNSRVTTFSDNAFAGCSNLIAVQVPVSVTFIGSNCFNGAEKLHILFEAMDKSGITFGEGWNKSGRPVSYSVKELKYKEFSNNGSFYYYETYQNTLGFLKWVGINERYGPTDDLDITEIDGKPFVEIGEYAFANAYSYYESSIFDWGTPKKHITITIGKNVEKVGAYAFYNLFAGLPSSVLDSSVSYFKIDFERNSNIKFIGLSAFNSSHMEGDVILGKNIEVIGETAFSSSDTNTLWIEKTDKSGVSLYNKWNGGRTVHWGIDWEYDGEGVPTLKN